MVRLPDALAKTDCSALRSSLITKSCGGREFAALMPPQGAERVLGDLIDQWPEVFRWARLGPAGNPDERFANLCLGS